MFWKHLTHEKDQKHLRRRAHLPQKEVLTSWWGRQRKGPTCNPIYQIKLKADQGKLWTDHFKQESWLQSHSS